MTARLSLDDLTNTARALDEEAFCKAFPEPALVISIGSDAAADEAFRTIGNERRMGLTLTAATAHAERMRGGTPAPQGQDVSLSFVAKSERNPFLGMITIGRADNNDVVLKHSTVSKMHAHIVKAGAHWCLVDDRSFNGTFLGDARLETGPLTPLSDGMVVRFGPHVAVRFCTPEGLYRRLLSGVGLDINLAADRVAIRASA